MGLWYILSLCGIWLSVWGIIQLGVMGYSYATMTVLLVPDVEPYPGEYADFDDYVTTCEQRYKIVAKNCFVAAYTYVWILVVCVVSMLLARFTELWLARRRLEQDEYYCNAPPPTPKFCGSSKCPEKTHTN